MEFKYKKNKISIVYIIILMIAIVATFGFTNIIDHYIENDILFWLIDVVWVLCVLKVLMPCFEHFCTSEETGKYEVIDGKVVITYDKGREVIDDIKELSYVSNNINTKNMILEIKTGKKTLKFVSLNLEDSKESSLAQLSNVLLENYELEAEKDINGEEISIYKKKA